MPIEPEHDKLQEIADKYAWELYHSGSTRRTVVDHWMNRACKEAHDLGERKALENLREELKAKAKSTLIHDPNDYKSGQFYAYTTAIELINSQLNK